MLKRWSQFPGTLNVFLRDERGATTIEYAIIASVVSIGILASALSVGTSLSDFYDAAADAFN